MKSVDVFEALAHPIRREILELLRDHSTLSAGALSSRFPEVSRVAVSKHLAVLRMAGLVASEAHGREHWYRLDPGPLEDVYRRWLVAFQPVWDSSLPSLKARVERGDAGPAEL